MAFKCPKCKSSNLEVQVVATARLLQSSDNVETDINGDHTWDDDSMMTCLHCGFSDKALAFDTDQDEPGSPGETQLVLVDVRLALHVAAENDAYALDAVNSLLRPRQRDMDPESDLLDYSIAEMGSVTVAKPVEQYEEGDAWADAAMETYKPLGT